MASGLGSAATQGRRSIALTRNFSLVFVFFLLGVSIVLRTLLSVFLSFFFNFFFSQLHRLQVCALHFQNVNRIGQGQLVSLDYCIWIDSWCLLGLLSFSLCVIFSCDLEFCCLLFIRSLQKRFFSLSLSWQRWEMDFFFFKLIHEHSTFPNKMWWAYSTGLSIRKCFHLSHTSYVIFSFSCRWTGHWTRFLVKQDCFEKPQMTK